MLSPRVGEWAHLHELGLADALQLLRAVRLVHGVALREHGLDDVVAAVVDVVGTGALVVSEATDPDVVGVLVVDSPPPQADKNNKTAANPTRNLIEPNYARSLGRSRGVGFAQTVLKDFAELVLWHLVNEFDAARHLVSPYQPAAMFDDCFGAQSLFGLNDDHCRDKLT